MEIVFESLRELYARVEPALETKRMEMIRDGYAYIKKEDVWNYLKEEKWKKGRDLSLAEMVSDILNSDNILIDLHFKKQLKDQTRRLNLDEE